ncbi:LysR family transcriptional regulator [Kibdelosporangium philippinense]|uniref:LysR family transcriptional regulator n=1 Tax=Kibdelosporangium philippinense TaxID=211113 RepID=A0ABS8Z7Y0_9PSEU|nr:LysR family transcriptional regulator [Kibdelosporangium philippinense]MCE7002771.1 LysR family transcriptional regulator [Kibdelosporangium philippinense]
MLLRQLEYLVALAREGHFSRAAQACHVSQPSLSAAIRKLEHELDVPIVRRGNRYDGLTPEGERVLLWAHRILAECEELRQDLSTMENGLAGTLRIGAIPTTLTVAPLLTTPFCARYPRARVSIESLSSQEIVHRLTEFELDVGMTYLDGEPLGRVRTFPLYEEKYLLLVPVDHELAEQQVVGWAQAAKQPLCLLSEQMRNRRILDEMFASAGAMAVPSIETDTVSALYAHVATRNWCSVISHAWLNMFGVPQGMRVVPLERIRPSPRIGLVIADRDPEPIVARSLVDVSASVDVRAALAAHLR